MHPSTSSLQLAHTISSATSEPTSTADLLLNTLTFIPTQTLHASSSPPDMSRMQPSDRTQSEGGRSCAAKGEDSLSMMETGRWMEYRSQSSDMTMFGKEAPTSSSIDLDCQKRAIDEKGVDLPAGALPAAVGLVWPPWRRYDGWCGWMGDTVSANALVLSLITQAFSTGILDATTYLDFNTFASNQTGNTILLTVAVVKMSGHLLLLTGVSLGSFLGSALVLGHLGHLFGVRRRAWLLCNVFFQQICLVIATIFLSPHGPSATRLGGDHQWSIIMLFAMMSGAQVASARQASIQEIPTAPMTSSYVDLVSDKHLFVGFGHPNAGGRNRRLAYILAMIVGSFIGALMHKYAGSWVVVVVAMGFKLAVMIMICLAPADPRREKQ